MQRDTFSPHALFLGALSLALGLCSLACDSAVEETPEQNVPAHADLFACGVPLSCPEICIHLGYGDCGGMDSLSCTGDLWVNGSSGTFLVNDRPGPGGWMADKLTFLLGDGRALVQQRTRECTPVGTGCNIEELPWELGVHQICDVKAVPSTCQAGSCADIPLVENCADLDKDWTCAEIKTVLSPAP